MEKQKTMCIIGFGVSGIISAKYALEQNVAITIFEKQSECGGVWSDAGCVWSTLQANSEKSVTCFKNFLWDIKEDYPYKHQMLAYLKSYVEKFKLHNYVLYNTEVTMVKLSEDQKVEITYRKENKDYKQIFDYLIIASGVYRLPKMTTDLIPKENCKLEIMHSKNYKSPEYFKGKRVLVIGHSHSAAQISEDLSPKVESVINLFREPYWILSRYCKLYDRILPTSSVFFSNREDRIKLSHLPDEEKFKIYNNLISSMFKQNDCHKELYIDPDTKIKKYVSGCDNYLQLCKEGKIIPKKGEMAKIEQKNVILKSGELIENIDIILLCTGFEYDLSYFSEELQQIYKINDTTISHYNQIDLDYHRIANSRVKSIAFVGIHYFTLWLTLEIQAELAIDYLLKGDVKELDKNREEKEIYDDYDYNSYLDKVAEVANQLPTKELLEKLDEHIKKYVMKGPTLVQHFQLNTAEMKDLENLKKEIDDINHKNNIFPAES
jgi:dimethylaniline monooxygenase (N-oxide forming)